MDQNELKYTAAEKDTSASAILYVVDASSIFAEGFFKRTFRAEFASWNNQQLYCEWYLAALIRGEARYFGCRLTIQATDTNQQEATEKAVKEKADKFTTFSGDTTKPLDAFQWSQIVVLLNSYAYKKGKELRISSEDISMVKELASIDSPYRFLAQHVQRKIAKAIAPSNYGAGMIANNKAWAWATYMPFNNE